MLAGFCKLEQLRVNRNLILEVKCFSSTHFLFNTSFVPFSHQDEKLKY